MTEFSENKMKNGFYSVIVCIIPLVFDKGGLEYSIFNDIENKLFE